MRQLAFLLALAVSVLATVCLPVGVAAQDDPGPYSAVRTVGRGLVRSVVWSPTDDVIAVGGALGIWLYTPGLDDIGLMTGHKRAVYDLAFSPDGKRLASASHDLTVRVWDVAAQEALFTLEGHASLVVAVGWHPTADLIASGAYDGTIRLWNPADGTLVAVLEGHTGWVSDVAFSPDGSYLASAGYDGTVRVWDVAALDLLATFRGHVGPVSAVTWAHADAILSAGWDGSVREWGLASEAPAWVLAAHEDTIYDVQRSPNGMTFATASFDGTVGNWYYRDQTQVGTLATHAGRVYKLAWEPAGTRLATLSWDDTVRVWDTTRGEQIAMQHEHMDWIDWVGWDEAAIRALTRDGRMNGWDAASGLLTRTSRFNAAHLPSEPPPVPGSRTFDITADGIVQILEHGAGDPVVIATLPGRANAAAWSPDGTALAVGVRNGTVTIWQAND